MPAAPVKPMLASTGPLPAGPGWAYEFKWDGVRAIADTAAGRTRLWARSGTDITAAYPELRGLGRAVPDAVLDGEIVVFGPDGRPSFNALAERMHVREPGRAARLAAAAPVSYLVFDLLRLGAADLIGLPYADRRRALEELVPAEAHWLVPPSFPDGAATRAAALANSLEGIVAKRVDSLYRPGQRTPEWVKIKLEETEEFVVGGWRPGARRIGGLLIGVPAGQGRLSFRGRVGGGIGAAAERDLLAALEPLRTSSSPFVDPVPREDARGANWVTPCVVVEVKYGQRTPDGRLRFPRFLRLRPDKTVEEVDGG